MWTLFFFKKFHLRRKYILWLNYVTIILIYEPLVKRIGAKNVRLLQAMFICYRI